VIKIEKDVLVIFQGELSSILVVLNFINGKFSVGFENFEGLLVFEQIGILLDKLENLLNDFDVFLQNVIKHPLVHTPTSEQSSIFEVNQMPAGFGLGEIKNQFQIRNTQLFIEHQQMHNPHPRLFS
jgi:hypothetical protein